MKKIFVLFFGLLTSLFLFSQQIEKNYVLVEIATGTWCYYCPGAALGAEDLVDNGHNVAIVEHHTSDDFSNSASNARNNYYNPSGIPSAYFDGDYAGCGGSHTSSRYSCYLPKYNNAISELTSFDIDLEVSTTDDVNFDATITIDKVDSYSGSNLVAHLVLTESHIDYNWQGLSELHWVTRAMYPNPSGVSLDFSSQTQEVIELQFQADSEWDIENCEIVAFIQDNDNKNVLNSDKESLNIPIGTNNAIVKQITYPADTSIICPENINPVIELKNKGSQHLSTVDLITIINEEKLDTLNWTGNLEYGSNEEVVLENVTYNQLQENEIVILAENPNGVPDDYPENNSDTAVFYKSDETTTTVYLEMHPSVWSFELSYGLYNSDGDTLYFNDDFTDNVVLRDTFNLNIDQCYNFELYDEYGDGFKTDDGYCKLTDYYSDEFFYVSGNFGFLYDYSFRATTLVNLSKNSSNTFKVYPNPTENLINIEFIEKENYTVKIYNFSGKILDEKNINSALKTQIDVKNYPAGIYFITISSDNLNSSKKIIIQ